jgi:hypothetical protein
VELLGPDHAARELLQVDARAVHDIEQLFVEVERALLVIEALPQDGGDVVAVGLLDLGDAERRVPFEARQELSDLLRVQERFVGLGLHESDDREPVRARDHQSVVRVANDAGELIFHDLVEQGRGGVHIEIVHEIIGRTRLLPAQGRVYLCDVMKWMTLLAAAVPAIAVGPELKEEAPALEAPIVRVTVFSDRARIVRVAHAEVKAGVSSFRLPDLPGAVLLDTVRVTAKGARVLRAEASPVEREIVSIDQVKGLIDELEKVADQIREIDQQIALERRELERLESIHPAPPVEEKDRDGRKGLQVVPDAWFKAIDFLGGRDASGRARIQKLESDRLKLDERRNELAREIESKNLGAFTDVRVETFVAIDSAAAKKLDIELEYFIGGARWKPAYDLRFEQDGKLLVETAAMVQQATGEDWNDVELLLSTAIPGQGIDLPELLTWTLGESRDFLPRAIAARRAPPPPRFSPPTPQATRAEEKRRIEIEILRSRFAQATGRTPIVTKEEPSVVYSKKATINFEDDAIEGELTKPEGAYLESRKADRPRPPAPAPRVAADAPAAAEESYAVTLSSDVGSSSGPSFQRRSLALFEAPPPSIAFSDPYLPAVTAGGLDYVYEAPTRTTIPSKAEDRRVPLASQSFQASTVHEATPSLDTTAYVKAKVKNGSGRPLLRGPTNIFVGGEFVGQGEIQTTGPGGEIGFPLGADENVRLVRTVVPATKREGFISKDDVTTYAVKLQIGNYKKRAITIEVIDQVPKTSHEDVEIEFLSANPKPLAEPDADGVMRWRLEVPASQTKTIEFSYTIGRPADWQLYQ